MNNSPYQCEQMGDDPFVTGKWDGDKGELIGQEEDDPKKSKEWDDDKKPVKSETDA